jgi:hypothetical protein
MPLKDPEARKQYDRERRRGLSPEKLEQRRRTARELARRPRADPAKNEGIRAARQRWEAKNPEGYRRVKLARRYGITSEEYAHLVKVQANACAICLLPERVCDPRSGKLRALAVDHDHATGRVRGLLCYRCNKAIGYLGENRESMARAITYLEER